MGSFLSLAFVGFMGAILSSVGSSRQANDSPTVHFPDQPAAVHVKSDSANDSPQRESLRTLVETYCPTLFTPFKPLWWLFKCVYEPISTILC